MYDPSSCNQFHVATPSESSDFLPELVAISNRVVCVVHGVLLAAVQAFPAYLFFWLPCDIEPRGQDPVVDSQILTPPVADITIYW